MGNSCTHAADAVAHLVTEAEIHEAVRSIEEWQLAQTMAVRNGGPGQTNCGPLLQRVGGPDVVKTVVELFYRKLYSDPRLILFLHDQDIMHLRAKQSAFVSWLFGPPNVPYVGRSVRIAHLRIIKQRGFSPEDFDMGMRYFEQSMAELGAPEVIMGEVMRRMRPFRDAFFTPSSKDGEEEARWAAEERAREEEVRQQLEVQHHQEEEVEEHHKQERQLLQQITMAHKQEAEEAAAAAAEGADWVADAAVAAAVAAAMSTAAISGAVSRKPSSRPASRAPQCPFTGGRLSRPVSAAPPAAALAVAAAPPAASSSSPRVTSSPTSPVGGTASSRPGTANVGTVNSPRSPPAAAAATTGSGSSRPASQQSPHPASSSSSSRPHTAADAAATSPPTKPVPSPSAMPPASPLTQPNRPGSVGSAGSANKPAAAAVSDPLAEFEAEINEIERAYSPPEKTPGKDATRTAGSLEPSPSSRKTAAVF